MFKYFISIFLLLFSFGCSSLKPDNSPKSLANKNSDEYLLYMLQGTDVYATSEKITTIGKLDEGDCIEKFDYYKKLHMLYLEKDEMKGWIDPTNTLSIRKCIAKLIILNDNTTSFDKKNKNIKNTYQSGDVIESKGYDEVEAMYLLNDSTWIDIDKVANLNYIKYSSKNLFFYNLLYISITALEIALLVSL